MSLSATDFWFDFSSPCSHQSTARVFWWLAQGPF
jgi:2-hydroxychromene-2-carboxylate isomerase